MLASLQVGLESRIEISATALRSLADLSCSPDTGIVIVESYTPLLAYTQWGAIEVKLSRVLVSTFRANVPIGQKP